MTEELVRTLLERHGATGNFVRAYCKSRGWKGGINGAPAEWYEAYRGELNNVIEQILVSTADSDH